MFDVPRDLLGVLYQLLPGFFAAGIFYTLTAHPKGNTFERSVQALIFTAIIQGFVALTAMFFMWCGHHVHWGPHLLVLGYWTETSSLLWSFLFAIVLGVLASRNANCTTRVFALLRACAGSRRTASPSQWYSAFQQYKRYIILHLEGERRLKGWAEEWPDESDKGHFIIDQPVWVLDDGTDVELVQVKKMLVPAKQVTIVEFVQDRAEVSLTDDQIVETQKRLTQILTKKEESDGTAKPTTGGCE